MNQFEDPIVSISSSQRGWAAELTRFVSDYGGARLRGTILTMDDALEQDFEVLVVDDIASYMSPRFVERLRRMHRKIVGIYDPDLGEESKDRLLAMGVDAVVDAFATPEEILEAVLGVRGVGGAAIERAPAPPPTPFDEPQMAPNAVTVVGDDHAVDVALGIADSLIGLKKSAVLIDADTVAPCLAQRLGLPVGPNVLTALDALTQLRGRPADSFQTSPRGFAMLPGIPSPDEWDTLQPRDLVELVEHLGESGQHVIAKVDRGVEDLAPLSGRAGRFDVTRSLLGAGGQAVVVTEATPLALTRLLTWVAQAKRLLGDPIHVVFHHSPKSLYQRGELSEELVRSYVPASITWLPSDARLQRAVWNGEMVPAGTFMRATTALTKRLLERVAAGAVR